ncbi:ribosome-recycling factor [Svornostia abyssi]|uniref:Ribosome-recycling factor n=1 Tax=Svornostia abyssi TaxID=2898438 RepID=A0ABY5PCZ7_9ACTN|nr:ribosome-recycling factor [Parviterribacteraceae bacterium J379]
MSAPTTSIARRGELQKLTDAKVGEVDAVLKAKEDEILEV